ncbi:ABC transporter substrate-binding protein [Microbacterium gorillae]|uniref:ABC transporter substrate-binding protein n=1 Tax=Microbacterium gorillae TaxID=1231063 RepID=UPI000A5762CE|nr:ABC transporter substrate-binding protein [Microbacterium gorillae]
MTRKAPRIVAGLMIAGLSALTLTGCFGSLNGSDSGSGGTAGADGGKQTSFIAVNNGEIKRVTGAQNPGSQIAMAICEPLTGIKEDGSVFMRGAKSVESDDQKHWTVVVAPDHTFSDGTKIDAQTYVDTFNFIATGKNAMPSNYAYGQIAGYDEINKPDDTSGGDTLSGLKVVDANTFTIDMKTPNNDVPYMLSTLPFCPVPASGLKDMTAYDKKPIGNGVYTLDSLDPQVEAVLTKDPKYKGWVPDGAADKITFRVYTDTNTAYQDVAAGNADVLRSLPPGLIAQARNSLGDKGLTAIDRNTLETYVLWPTYLDKEFPIEVRQAFSMIINRASIAKDLFKGAVAPATSLMPNSVSAYREGACGEYCEYNPTKAKELLAKANFTGTIPFNYSADNTTDAALALAVSNAAKEIGLNVEPRPTPAANLSEKINDYKLDGPSTSLWGSSFPAASEWIASITVDANYHLKYTNDSAQADIVAAWGSKDEAAANKLWQSAEDKILADQVIQPLYEQVMYIAHTPCMKPHAAGGDMQFLPHRGDLHGMSRAHH